MSGTVEKRQRENENGAASGSRPSKQAADEALPPVDDGAGQFNLCVGTPGFSGPHDLGGVTELLGTKVDLTEKPLTQWEHLTHALLVSLVSARLLTVDELRRHIECLEPAKYATWGYYDKWSVAIALGMLERGVISPSDLDAALGHCNSVQEPDGANSATVASTVEPKVARYAVGQVVVVRAETAGSLVRWRKPHLRTPGYLFGCSGVVESLEGVFGDPEFLAFRGGGGQRREHLYRVSFKQADLWPEAAAATNDRVVVEVYEPWLLSADDDASSSSTAKSATGTEESTADSKHSFVALEQPHDHSSYHDHDHDHDHGHDHVHIARSVVEQRAIDKEGSERPGERISGALIAILEKQGIIERAKLNKIIEANESLGRRLDGAKLVAKAWVDPAFKARLLSNPAEAAAELGINTINSTTPTKLKIVACSESEHHLIVCTLCSCYPLSLLGLSPPWYKSRAYRARAVREPRAMLQDSFGLVVPPEVSITVHDSTADLRFLVLPLRPAGTDDWSEEELEKLATRDSMIGVSLATKP